MESIAFGSSRGQLSTVRYSTFEVLLRPRRILPRRIYLSGEISILKIVGGTVACMTENVYDPCPEKRP